MVQLHLFSISFISTASNVDLNNVFVITKQNLGYHMDFLLIETKFKNHNKNFKYSTNSWPS